MVIVMPSSRPSRRAEGGAVNKRLDHRLVAVMYTDVASVRGVGLSLIGLAATEAAEGLPEKAVQIAAAAEVYADQEGIVNVYSDETPGREFVDQARAALSADDVAKATEVVIAWDPRLHAPRLFRADRMPRPSITEKAFLPRPHELVTRICPDARSIGSKYRARPPS
jgi:fructose-specific phosphotransferase system component IIB